MREVPGRAANLPDALVGQAPLLLEVLQQHLLKWPARVGCVRQELASAVQSIEHYTKNVDLQLAGSAIADAHRLGALIAREPGKLDLGEAPLAGEPIHDLQLRRTSGGSAQHPLAPCSRLVPVTRCQQGIERERGIADPAVAVVPVALTADLLGQRGRRCRHDAARWRESQCLQGNQRAGHRVSPVIRPSTAELAATRPAEPPGFSLLQSPLRVDAALYGPLRGAPGKNEGEIGRAKV